MLSVWLWLEMLSLSLFPAAAAAAGGSTRHEEGDGEAAVPPPPPENGDRREAVGESGPLMSEAVGE